MPQKPFLVESHHQSYATVKILLADDFAPWRSAVCSFVRRQTDWEIVCEARDGLEAVQKTAELQPDVALIDLNMPGINGIEATRRIRQLSPNTQIVILTQISDDDLEAAALAAGAIAYVLKSEMTTELIPAVQLALRTPG